LVSYIVTMINPALTLVFTFIAPSSRIAAGAAAGRAVPPPADRNLARPRLPPPLFEVSEVFRNFPATPSGAGRRAALIPVFTSPSMNTLPCAKPARFRRSRLR
jgi:hypothetical protein